MGRDMVSGTRMLDDCRDVLIDGVVLTILGFASASPGAVVLLSHSGPTEPHC